MTKAVKDKTQDQRIADLEAKVDALVAAAASADPTLGAAIVAAFICVDGVVTELQPAEQETAPAPAEKTEA